MFEKLQSLQNIIDYSARLSNSDGEDLNFELKGSSGRAGGFKNEDKNLIGREICAFANTYGGMICFHAGGGTGAIEPFDNAKVGAIFESLESWLINCLSPLLRGCNVKLVENVFLINVPASGTKPHQYQKGYYYRTASSSVVMPEIMVGAMYRAGDYLEFDIGVEFSWSSNKLSVVSEITNLSTVAGTKPRLKIHLFGPDYAVSPSRESQFLAAQEPNAPDISFRNLNYTCTLTSTALFHEILYPKDSLSTVWKSHNEYKPGAIGSLFAYQVDCVFLQRPSLSVYGLMRFDNGEFIMLSENRSTILEMMAADDR